MYAAIAAALRGSARTVELALHERDQLSDLIW